MKCRANNRKCVRGTGVARISLIVFVAGMFGLPTPTYSANSAFLASKGRASAPGAATTLCDRYKWACAGSSSQSQATSSQLQLVRSVNRRINRAVNPVDDSRQYGVEDLWSLPTSRGGDCEDYALVKKFELIRQGIPADQLLIATVLDRARNPHAVLVFRASEGDMILDNLTDTIRPWEETRYFFIRMQDPEQPSRWIGVYSGG